MSGRYNTKPRPLNLCNTDGAVAAEQRTSEAVDVLESSTLVPTPNSSCEAMSNHMGELRRREALLEFLGSSSIVVVCVRFEQPRSEKLRLREGVDCIPNT